MAAAPYPPYNCPGHGKPCDVRHVREGAHQGRPFYTCTCVPHCKNWFQWADAPHKQLGKKRAAVVLGADVRISITTVDDEQKLKMAFGFDDEVAGVCREFGGAHYSPEAGGWLLPMNHRDNLERRMEELKDNGTIRTLQMVTQSAAASPQTPRTAAASSAAAASPGRAAAAATSPGQAAAAAAPVAAPPPPLDLPPTLTAGLMPHQREAVEFVVANGLRGLVADDMGLGKTVTAIAVLAHAKEWPALVLCPASVKYNWRAELLRWLPELLNDTSARVQVVDAGKAGWSKKVPSWQCHGWPPRAHQTASEGLWLPSALVRRGPAPRIPPGGRDIPARGRPS